MKSLLNIYTSVILLVLGTAFSSCEQQMVEPAAQVTTVSADVNTKMAKFTAGNYIVQFQNDSTLQLNNDDNIRALAEGIAASQLTFTDIYNFDGFKGFTGYLNKHQVRSFYFDARVLVIEADTPIGPMAPTTENETNTELISI